MNKEEFEKYTFNRICGVIDLICGGTGDKDITVVEWAEEFAKVFVQSVKDESDEVGD